MGRFMVDGHEVWREDEEAEVMRRLEHDKEIALDTETTALDPWHGSVATVQLYGKETGTLYVGQYPWGVSGKMCQFLSRPGVTWVGHNITNFDLPFLHVNAGVDILKGTFYDTLIAEAAVSLENRAFIRKDLATSIRRRTGLEVKKDIEHGNWGKPLTEEQLNYAARDVLALPALKAAQLELAEKRAGSQRERGRSKTVLDAIALEMELIPVVAGMTILGLPVDPDALKDYIQKTIIARDARLVYLKATYGDINPNSRAQVMNKLKELGAAVPNAKEETLAEVEYRTGVPEAAVDFARTIIDCKHLDKRASTYGETWSKNIMPDGRIHFRFWQLGTDTGRFSSSEPQGQNLPRDMRYVFGGLPGHIISATDYSQIEWYTAAWYSGDEQALASLTQEDVHRANASTLFEVSPEQVEKLQRKMAKGVTFGIIYVGSKRAIYAHAKSYGAPISLDQAEQLRVKFLSKFPGIARMHDSARRIARLPQYMIDLPTGLQRQMIGKKLTPQRVVNTIIQGTAGAGIKYGMLEAKRRGLTWGYLAAQVHDELDSVVPLNEATEYQREMEEAMLSGMAKVLPIPAKVATHQGPSWAADD